MFNDAHFLMNLLGKAGFETRIAGGAVRDMLLGETPKDIDLATIATPDEVVTMLKKNHIGYVDSENARKHGTITAIVNHVPFEITTLRIDKTTDGRHAEVEFVTDWEVDASRRDFTINAMFMDKEQVVYDYFTGKEDIETKLIRFVGNADERIKEDYLRILRFYRFVARFDSATESMGKKHDTEDHRACLDLLKNLKSISKERIWTELCKIFYYKTESSKRIIHLLWGVGFEDVFNDGLCMFPNFPINCEHAASAYWGCFGTRFMDIMPLSREEKFISDKLQYLSKTANIKSLQDIALLVAFHGHDIVKEFLQVAWWGPERELLSKLGGLPYDSFPVSGQDLLDMGIPAGKRMGEILKELKIIWAKTIFKADKDFLLAKVPELI